MRVLVVTNGISSTLHASLELIARLQERGHTCVLACHVDRSAEASANDVEFVHLSATRRSVDAIRAAARSIRGSGVTMPRRVIDLCSTAWAAHRSTRALDELHALVDELDPAVVIADIEAHVAILGVLASGRPLVLTTFLFGVHECAGLPPIGSKLLPGEPGIESAWQRVHEANAAAASWRFRQALVDLAGPVSYGTTSGRALRSLARAQGVDLDAVTTDRSWLRPHGYRGITTLSCNLRELEFDHEVPADWHYVGPMVRTSRRDAAVASDTDDQWQAWLALAEHSETACYASLGSFWDSDRTVLGAIVEAFRDRPERALLLGLGGRLDPADLGPLPPNVIAMTWAPQVDALRTVDAAIVHGGNAALNECVVAGVPLVVVSTEHLDQPGVAARVEFHGIGVRLDRGATSGAVSAAVDRVTTDTGIRARIEALAALASDPRRRRLAVEMIEAAATR